MHEGLLWFICKLHREGSIRFICRLHPACMHEGLLWFICKLHREGSIRFICRFASWNTGSFGLSYYSTTLYGAVEMLAVKRFGKLQAIRQSFSPFSQLSIELRMVSWRNMWPFIYGSTIFPCSVSKWIYRSGYLAGHRLRVLDLFTRSLWI